MTKQEWIQIIREVKTTGNYKQFKLMVIQYIRHHQYYVKNINDFYLAHRKHDVLVWLTNSNCFNNF